jgi:hypothetical protein
MNFRPCPISNVRCAKWLQSAVRALLSLVLGIPLAGQSARSTDFEISFATDIRAEPVTGRMFVFIAKTNESEPRLQLYRGSALFAVNVSAQRPGVAAILDQSTNGFPPESLRDVPAGDYYVQALLNIYTEFHRADGHVIWAHMDQWEGQNFTRSPGNLTSEVRKVHLDPAQGYQIKLELTRKIPAIEMPADTPWVKRFKMQSPLLSRFWGRPIYIGATVLLPKGYDDHPGVQYPTMYLQGHFNLDAPFGFSTKLDPAEKSWARDRERAIAAHLNMIEPPPYSHHNGALGNVETGYEFYQAWNSEHFPRMIAVTFQHPSPYYDDSYAVNSENEGPYGDAIMTELIPFLESHFRMIPQPWARTLTGGSTGGWESLALQVYHPDFFGGVWTFYPDPVDLRRYNGGIDIYNDENAFTIPNGDWLQEERLASRTIDGQTRITVRQMSRLQSVVGDKERSTIFLNDYEVVINPVGDDGYPIPLWDKSTGKINRDVARYAREHGYDLREYLERNWPTMGRDLVGKVHIYCGESDGNFLNLTLYLLQDFLENTRDPYYAGSFEFGRPLKGHGWQPTTNAELVRKMAAAVTQNAPKEEHPDRWQY